jgi:hypothetical protein
MQREAAAHSQRAQDAAGIGEPSAKASSFDGIAAMANDEVLRALQLPASMQPGPSCTCGMLACLWNACLMQALRRRWY